MSEIHQVITAGGGLRDITVDLESCGLGCEVSVCTGFFFSNTQRPTCLVYKSLNTHLYTFRHLIRQQAVIRALAFSCIYITFSVLFCFVSFRPKFLIWAEKASLAQLFIQPSLACFLPYSQQNQSRPGKPRYGLTFTNNQKRPPASGQCSTRSNCTRCGLATMPTRGLTLS